MTERPARWGPRRGNRDEPALGLLSNALLLSLRTMDFAAPDSVALLLLIRQHAVLAADLMD